ncbi:MAG: hypothetical protein O7D94_09855, partial [Planctomycetota bacterium]|nr:hypothetical protein [Planctomycetota bacterium]
KIESDRSCDRSSGDVVSAVAAEGCADCQSRKNAQPDVDARPITAPRSIAGAAKVTEPSILRHL